MISFYPGPSKVYDAIPEYVRDAHKKGILSVNHRSEEFIKISQKTIGLLKQKLNIPKNYTLYYTSSATECWEIIAQSLITKKSHHFFNGSFGQKWFEYTKRIRPDAKDYTFEAEVALDPKKIKLGSGHDVICITQNETSNGTQVTNAIIQEIKERNPNQLVAVDATSSMGGIILDFKAADLWFASVQKCFGLPAGLGILVLSPEAIKRVKKINDKKYYNSLTFMTEMIEKWQTPYTPNVLNIYLLMRVMEEASDISELDKKIRKRYERWIDFLDETKSLRHLIKNKTVHSYTVLPIAALPETVNIIKREAKKKGLLLGEGYGNLKSSTFRIANFPAIKKKEIEKLQKFLKSFALN